MQVKDFMSVNPITVSNDQTVMEAAKIMVEKKISILPVVCEQGKLLGVITQSDFVGKTKEIPRSLVTIKEVLGETFHNRDVEEIYKSAQAKKISEVMSLGIVSVQPSHSMNDVVNLMITNDYKRIPVVETDGQLVGIVTRRNVLKAFTEL